ncbi:MAG: hypothetical protein LBN18_03440 [Dysgonamonadaceae bacterium]|jgi:hypothetical protein|nr:hypothetical protein [Dysgonamonadaceae bacterium]
MQAIVIKSKKNHAATKEKEQHKKLSRAGQWMKDNPRGIIVINDWKAIMR